MVVPDDVTIGKLPQINGLLAYQKDAEALRFRKNSTWKEIAEKEVICYFLPSSLITARICNQSCLVSLDKSYMVLSICYIFVLKKILNIKKRNIDIITVLV